MQINHNINSMIGQAALYQNQRSLSSSLEKLSTGLRINRASDDAAGLALSETLRTQVRGAAQAARNAADGIAMLEVADSASSEISANLQKMRELAIQARTETIDTTQRSYIAAEFDALEAEVLRMATNTTFNGDTIIGAQAGAKIIHTGPNASDQITVTTTDLTAVGAGDDISTVAGADLAIAALDADLVTLNAARSTVGANVNVLQSAMTSMQTLEFNNQAAESAIRDTDFAKETTNFTRASILAQAGMAMLSQAKTQPASVMALLG